MQRSHDTILHLESHMTKSSTKVSISDFCTLMSLKHRMRQALGLE